MKKNLTNLVFSFLVLPRLGLFPGVSEILDHVTKETNPLSMQRNFSVFFGGDRNLPETKKHSMRCQMFLKKSVNLVINLLVKN